MPYLIDGHNLIAHLDDIDLTDPHDEAKLILKLRGFTARVQKQCIVIFDRGLPGGTSSLSTHSVKVVFAAAHQTNADRIIMERIQRTPDTANWTVVSSDEEIRIAAQSAGMNAMHCAAFATKVNPAPKQKPHRGIDAHVRVSEDEIDEWLDVFGDDVDIPDDNITPAEPIRPTRKKPAPRAKASPPAKKTDKQRPASNKSDDNSQRQTKKNMPKVRSEAGHHDVHVSDKEVEAWMDVFGDGTDRKPTDKAQRIQPRNQQAKKTQKDTASDTTGSDTPDENSVEAWLEVFGEEDASRQPTDPAPQRKRPDKQGHFGSKKTRRDPTVHKNMGTSDDVFLSDGEVEAWMDLFKQGDDSDE